MKPVQIILLVIFCALAATWASLRYKPSKPPAIPLAKQSILSRQRFQKFYGLDTFTFNKEAYFILINEKETALYKLNNLSLELIPADLFPANQKLIQNKIDTKGRLALVLEEKGELTAELLDGASRRRIKLGKLEHKNFGHGLCCADILSEGDELFVWHDSQFLKFDLSKNPPRKTFDRKLSFDTSDKGNLLALNGRVYLELRDGQKHYFDSESSTLKTEKSDLLSLQSKASDGSDGMAWNYNWPEPHVQVDKVLNLGRPVILSAKEGIFYLDEFNRWIQITSHVAMFDLSASYPLANGKILFVGQREEVEGGKNIRHLTIFDTINNTYDILTLILG